MASIQEGASILLGASAYPKAKLLNDGGASFKKAHAKIKQIILPLIKSDRLVLDLFDSEMSASDQYEKMDNFIATIKENTPVRNLFIFYTGHGGISDAEQVYCLTIRDTRKDSIYQSSLHCRQIAKILRQNAKQFCRYIFLDSCFAGAAIVYGFQSSEQSVVDVKLREIKWDDSKQSAGGVAIICAASRYNAAKFLPDGTMFSEALIYSFTNGDSNKGELLTLDDIFKLITDRIFEEHPDEAVRPELHMPEQSQGLIHQRYIAKNTSWKIPNEAIEILEEPGASSSGKKNTNGSGGAGKSEHVWRKLGRQKIVFGIYVSLSIVVLATLVLYNKNTEEWRSLSLSEKEQIKQMASEGCYFFSKDGHENLFISDSLSKLQATYWNELKKSGKKIALVHYDPSTPQGRGRTAMDLLHRLSREKNILDLLQLTNSSVAMSRASVEAPYVEGLYCYIRIILDRPDYND